MAPSRPSAGTALIKSLVNDLGLSSRLMDINLDFFNRFASISDPQQFHELDAYFYTDDTKLSESTQISYDKWCQDWCQRVVDFSPAWILLSIFTWQCQNFARDFIGKLRVMTDANIVIGGQGMIKSENSSFNQDPYFAKTLLQKKLIDFYIQGEAEKALPALLTGDVCHAGINGQEFAPRSGMDDVPFYDFSDHDIRAYHSGYPSGQLPLESSRGCVRACAFCDWPVYHSGFRSKSGSRLFDEIRHYYETTGVAHFYFNDALINGNLQDFRTFNQKLLAYYEQKNLPPRSITYSGMYIVRKPTQWREQDWELVAEAGADTLMIGAESGSERVRKEMAKGFTGADLDFTMQMASRYKIKVYFLMIVGWPSETREEFEMTLDLMRRYQRFVADGTILGINFGTSLTIGEGTPIYKDPDRFDIIGVKGQRPVDVFWMHKNNPDLTYKQRILRRIEAQELAQQLGYTFWKGDDQMTFLRNKYRKLSDEN